MQAARSKRWPSNDRNHRLFSRSAMPHPTRRSGAAETMNFFAEGVGAVPEMSDVFVLAKTDGYLSGRGLRQRLAPGPVHTLAERVRAYFAGSPANGNSLLMGAIPFDRMADDFLFQPEIVSHARPVTTCDARPFGHRWQVRPEPSRARYEEAVMEALRLIAESHAGDDPLEKIVLSRSLLLEADEPVDVMALLERLAGDPGAVRFLTPLGASAGGDPRYLTGATPELLIRKSGEAVLSHPLAGSSPRSADAAEDKAAAERLMRSQKDRREHQWVVEAILDGLAPYCHVLHAPDVPDLVSTRSMWHLATRIEGRLKDPEGVSAAELAAVLHPTPAVGGTPRGRALALIPELELYDRGFYAGAVGWTDRAGDGEWYVSLRCAEVTGRQVRVYAGAGIVEGSVPAEEADETSAKLQAILRALGIDEDGRTQSSSAIGAVA